MLDIAVISVLPELFGDFSRLGVVGRAFQEGRVRLHCIGLREFASDRHRTVDDAPYGGGPGMVLKPEPLAAAIGHARERLPGAEVVMLSPQGELFCDQTARAMAQRDALILLCGRFLGVDERVVESRVDRHLSVGDYVLSGGEIAAMAVVDAVMRHVPGVLGCADSPEQDSFAQGMLAPPVYTRPEVFDGMRVPETLLSGDHARISAWRDSQAKDRTSAWHRARRARKGR